ncbi:MAG: Hpt domain-containing protein [Nitrospiraceae bacterium]|jgi:HPt (histidine-containing phosphotransfer) domain-containing protein|nr:Hpt domain-containing protein [Nitrospiraceae bacterium]
MSTGPNRPAENVITVYIDEGLEEIVPGFLANRRRDVQTLETALEQDDFNTIGVIGHRMRGDGGGYGFDAISEIGEGMEQAAARQDKVAIRRHLSKLEDFLARLTVVYRR